MNHDLGSTQKLLGIVSAKCPAFMGLLRTAYAKLFLNDPYERIRLAKIGKRIGLKALKEIACIVKPLKT